MKKIGLLSNIGRILFFLNTTLFVMMLFILPVYKNMSQVDLGWRYVEIRLILLLVVSVSGLMLWRGYFIWGVVLLGISDTIIFIQRSSRSDAFFNIVISYWDFLVIFLIIFFAMRKYVNDPKA